MPSSQAVVDQLEWGDHQIAQASGKITNPAGFYISLLQRNNNPPPTFETSTARNARQRAELERQEALQRETEAQLAADAEAETQLDHLKATNPGRYRTLYDETQAQLVKTVRKSGSFAIRIRAGVWIGIAEATVSTSVRTIERRFRNSFSAARERIRAEE